MNQKIVASVLAFLAARSPRFRKLAPMIPLALGAYALYKRHRAAAQPQPAVAG